MAEIRIDQDGGDDRTILQGTPAPVPAAGLNRTPETDPEHLLPEEAGAGTPGMVAATDDPDTVRSEIERTRARMSSTIDEIEVALTRKRAEIEQKLDLTAPVRQKVRDNPWPAVGAVFAAGLVLGYLTGGDGEDEDRRLSRQARRLAAMNGMGVAGMGLEGDMDYGAGAAYGGGDAEWHARSRQWEERARKLMAVCNRQEEEIRHLRGSIGGVEMEDRRPTWRDTVAESVSGFVGSFFGGRGEEEFVVELEDEGAYGRSDAAYGFYDDAAAGDGDGSPALYGDLDYGEESDLQYGQGGGFQQQGGGFQQDEGYGRQTRYPNSLEDDTPRGAF
jgi:ElaB/YqjD/DUF883 family membrane-anchored ribosome-binding protein